MYPNQGAREASSLTSAADSFPGKEGLLGPQEGRWVKSLRQKIKLLRCLCGQCQLNSITLRGS